MNKKQLDESLKNHVINPYKRNYKICDIAKIYQVTNKTIYNIINKYNTTQSVQRKKGSGSKQDENIFNMIKEIINNDQNLALSDISSILLIEHNIKCSKSTGHLYLTKNDFVNKTPITKPLLSQEHLYKGKIGQYFIKIIVGKM